MAATTDPLAGRIGPPRPDRRERSVARARREGRAAPQAPRRPHAADAYGVPRGRPEADRLGLGLGLGFVARCRFSSTGFGWWSGVGDAGFRVGPTLARVVVVVVVVVFGADDERGRPAGPSSSSSSSSTWRFVRRRRRRAAGPPPRIPAARGSHAAARVAAVLFLGGGIERRLRRRLPVAAPPPPSSPSSPRGASRPDRRTRGRVCSLARRVRRTIERRLPARLRPGRLDAPPGSAARRGSRAGREAGRGASSTRAAAAQSRARQSFWRAGDEFLAPTVNATSHTFEPRRCASRWIRARDDDARGAPRASRRARRLARGRPGVLRARAQFPRDADLRASSRRDLGPSPSARGDGWRPRRTRARIRRPRSGPRTRPTAPPTTRAARPSPSRTSSAVRSPPPRGSCGRRAGSRRAPGSSP